MAGKYANHIKCAEESEKRLRKMSGDVMKAVQDGAVPFNIAISVMKNWLEIKAELEVFVLLDNVDEKNEEMLLRSIANWPKESRFYCYAGLIFDLHDHRKQLFIDSVMSTYHKTIPAIEFSFNKTTLAGLLELRDNNAWSLEKCLSYYEKGRYKDAFKEVFYDRKRSNKDKNYKDAEIYCWSMQECIKTHTGGKGSLSGKALFGAIQKEWVDEIFLVAHNKRLHNILEELRGHAANLL